MPRLALCHPLIARVFLLTFLLVGCSNKPFLIRQESPTAVFSPSAQVNSSDSSTQEKPPPLGTAQKSCGDSLPKDAIAYPANLYPVYVAYSENNFELIKKHFCEDAFKKAREKTGQDSVQVASFTSLETANEFKKKLSQHFTEIDIGEPTIVTEPPRELQAILIQPFETSSNNLEKSLVDAARLTINDLKSLEPLNDFNDSSVPLFKVLVPTYLPPKFQLKELKVNSNRKSKIKADYYRAYSLVYHEPKSNTYLKIEGIGFPTGGGGGVEAYEILETYSDALSRVNLLYVQFSRMYEGGFIEFETEYVFIGSHAYQFAFYSKSKNHPLSSVEAVKIANSLKWLQ